MLTEVCYATHAQRKNEKSRRSKKTTPEERKTMSDMLTKLADIQWKLFKILPKKEKILETDTGDADLRYLKGSSLETAVNNLVNAYMPMDDILNKLNLEGKPDALRQCLLGTAFGDIMGMPYEGSPAAPGFDPLLGDQLIKPMACFTDDTVMSVAIAMAALEIKEKQLGLASSRDTYASFMRKIAQKYPGMAYGGRFYNWAVIGIDDERYTSYGDGSAMRSGVIGAIFDDIRDVITQSVLSAVPTHSHPEGICGSVAMSVAIWILAHGGTKEQVKSYALQCYPKGAKTRNELLMDKDIPIDPGITLEALIAMSPMTMAIRCSRAVPEAFINLAHTDNFEDAVAATLYYSSDTDTVGAMTGAMAAVLYDTDFSIYGNLFMHKLELMPELTDLISQQGNKEEMNVL